MSGINVYPSVSAGGAPRDVQEFTASGTYTVPSGATWARIIAIGGGGSGGTSTVTAGGGGSGYFIDKWVQVTAGATHSVTIGAGGTGRSTAGTGAAGGATSVGSLVSVNGGGGGQGGGALVFTTGGLGERSGENAFGLWNGSTVDYFRGRGGAGYLGTYGGGTNAGTSTSSTGQSGYAIVYSY